MMPVQKFIESPKAISSVTSIKCTFKNTQCFIQAIETAVLFDYFMVGEKVKC